MKLLASLALIILIALLGWLTFEFIREVVRLYKAADPDIKLGVITATGSALAFVVNNAVQSSRERRARLFEAKREAYGDFIESFMSFFHKFALGEQVPEGDIVKTIQSLSTDVMTWGSAETVNAFNEYQRSNSSPTKDNNVLFGRTETFLRALRKDLGHSDIALEKFALTKLLLKGDEHEKLD
ncbi:MAG: hypothetical protein R3E04_02600 [Sphingobium sp.]